VVRPGDSVDIAWTSADESDVNLVQMRFIGPTGNWYYAYTNLNVHGTNSFTVDGDSFPNGRYRFDYLTVYDRAGNSTYYYASGQVERYPSGATPAPPASIDFATLLFWVGSIQVSPAAVTFTDKDGTAEDTYTVPSTDGVDYLVGDKVVPAGTYPGTGTVTVTAEARTDSVLASGAAAEWTATFKATFASPQNRPISTVTARLTSSPGTTAVSCGSTLATARGPSSPESDVAAAGTRSLH
jgi:hypothetical protein